MPDTVQPALPAPGEAWAERLWLWVRPRLGRCIALLTLLAGWCSYVLFRVVTRGEVIGGPGSSRWVRMEVAPAAFWFAVIQHVLGLAMCVGIPAWLAWDLRRLAKKRRAQRLAR